MKSTPRKRRKPKPQLPPETMMCLTLLSRERLRQLQALVGRKFKQPALLAQAVTHNSCHVEVGTRVVIQSNEKLEHFGDRVIGLAVCGYLHQKYPHKNEHFFSQVLRPALANKTLADIGEKLGLTAHLVVEKRSDALRNMNRPKATADALEAICGALFFDGGFHAADKFLGRTLYPAVDEIAKRLETTGQLWPPRERMEEAGMPAIGSATTLSQDESYRSKLVKRLHGLGRGSPLYRYSREPGAMGTDFTVTVLNCDVTLATGRGTSKKQAAERASQSALQKLENEQPPKPPSSKLLDPTALDYLPTALEPVDKIKTGR